MPLPTGGAAVLWPPPALVPVQAQLNTWAAWYEGDAGSLASAYAQPGYIARPSQYRGGVVGSLARWFWGTPPAGGEQRTKLHVPVAADIAAMSGDLLFSDPPQLVADDATTQARLDGYVDAGLWSSMREAAEIGAAMGGVYLRTVWDAGVADRPWISAVHPDAAVPEWSWGRLSAVTFWQVVEAAGERVVRLLERHEPGFIRYGLYDGSKEILGRLVPLTDHAATAGLAPLLTDGDAIATGYPRLTAAYVPNIKPNRVWRNVPAGADLGRSDYSGVEPLMDALDEVWSSWMRDIRLAKARLVVPQAALMSLGKGQGATFDTEAEILVGLNIGADVDQQGITPVQFNIRVAEHQATAETLVEQIIRGAGYSMQTFSANGDTAAVTATEVVARERRSLTTRKRKIRYWTPALMDALTALLAVDVAAFRPSGVSVQAPRVEFPDAVSADPKDTAQTLALLHQAEAASTEVKVRMLHPGWDDEAVAQEVAAIAGTDPAAPPAEGDDDEALLTD